VNKWFAYARGVHHNTLVHNYTIDKGSQWIILNAIHECACIEGGPFNAYVPTTVALYIALREPFSLHNLNTRVLWLNP